MTANELTAIRDRCRLAETRPERIHQLNAASDVPALLEEVDRLRQALEDVVHPIEMLRRTLPVGHSLDGDMAVRYSESVSCIQGIARDALNFGPPSSK